MATPATAAVDVDGRRNRSTSLEDLPEPRPFSLRCGIPPRATPAAKPIDATPATIVNTLEKVECPIALPAPLKANTTSIPTKQARQHAGDAEGEQRADRRR